MISSESDQNFLKLTCWFIVFDEDLLRFTTLYLLLMKELVLPTILPCLSYEYLERPIFFGETFAGFFEYFNKCFGATADLWSLTNLYFDKIVTASFLGTWVCALDWNALFFRGWADFSVLLKTREYVMILVGTFLCSKLKFGTVSSPFFTYLNLLLNSAFLLSVLPHL